MILKTVFAFAVRVLGATLGFIFSVVLARLLDVDGVGVYFLALSTVTIASVISRLGMDNALVRFVSVSKSREAWGEISGLYSLAIRRSLVASTILTLIVFVTSPFIANLYQEPQLVAILRLMSLGIVPISLLVLHAQIFNALDQLNWGIFIQNSSIPLINIFLLFIFVPRLEVLGAPLSYCISCLCVCAFSIVLWHRFTPQLRNIRGQFNAETLTAASRPLLWISLMSVFTSSFDTVMLGITQDSSQVGIYNAALKTTFLVVFVQTVSNSVISPKIASLYALGKMPELRHLAQKTTRYVTLIVIPIFIILLLFPESILALYGESFKAGALVLIILSVGQFINISCGAVGPLLMMSGHEKVFQRIIRLSTLLNFILNICLTPYLGMVGAAIATASGTIALNVIGTLTVRRVLGFWVIGILSLYEDRVQKM
jgi:O-antigen/teichoic acid export membrane protein